MEFKILINSIISEAHKGARFFSLDIKDFFLASPMNKPKYMKIPYNLLPQDIITHYNLQEKIVSDGHIYIKIKKGMYGLKQAAKLAHDKLVNHLKPFGYSPDPLAPNIWTHHTRKTKFCLCVDDFGVKTFSEEDSQHLISALKQAYNITIDKSGKEYCGLTLKWDYDKGVVDVSMPKFIQKNIRKTTTSRPIQTTTLTTAVVKTYIFY